jgi:hypothetical protein
VCTALARDGAEFEHMVGWVCGKLSAHGSESQPAEVATRVFVRALWSASTAAQWARFCPILEKSCTAEQWKAMVETYQVDKPVGDDGLLNAPPTAPPAAPAAATTAASTAASPTPAPASGNAAQASSGSGGCCIIA